VTSSVRSSNGQILVIGPNNISDRSQQHRSNNSLQPTLTLTTLMCLSFPRKTIMTLPSSHCPHSVSGATTKPTSLTWTSFCSFHHLDLRFKVGGYSRGHRCQKYCTSSCICFHLFLGLNWPLSTDPGANWPPTCAIRK